MHIRDCSTLNTPHGQMISAVVTVGNPDRRRVGLTTTMGRALRFGVISEENPEVHIWEAGQGMPGCGRGYSHPVDTTVAPEEFRGRTLMRTLLGDSLPRGRYRVVPELILYGPPEWANAGIHVPIEAGRASLKPGP